MLTEKNNRSEQRQITAPISDLVFQEDFLELAKTLVDKLREINTHNTEKLNKLRESFEKRFGELERSSSASISSEVRNLMSEVSKTLAQISTEHNERMKSVDDRVASILDGKDADPEEVLALLLERIHIPTIDELEKNIPSLGVPIRDSLELLQDDDRLDYKAVRGVVGIAVGPTPPADTEMLWIKTS